MRLGSLWTSWVVEDDRRPEVLSQAESVQGRKLFTRADGDPLRRSHLPGYDYAIGAKLRRELDALVALLRYGLESVLGA
jgi:hypothetical protein